MVMLRPHHCTSPRLGAQPSSSGEPGQGPGDGDGWRKLHVPPPLKWRVPQPHPDPDPTGARQQECHPGEEIPQRQVVQDDGGWGQKYSDI